MMGTPVSVSPLYFKVRFISNPGLYKVQDSGQIIPNTSVSVTVLWAARGAMQLRGISNGILTDRHVVFLKLPILGLGGTSL